MHLRVSADRLPALLPAIQGVGKLYTEDVQTTDNISQYEELARHEPITFPPSVEDERRMNVEMGRP